MFDQPTSHPFRAVFAWLCLAIVVSSALLVAYQMSHRESPPKAQLVGGGPYSVTETFQSTTTQDINYTDAAWDTQEGSLAIPNGKVSARALSLNVDKVSDAIITATLTVIEQLNGGTAHYYLSTDAGLTFVAATPGVPVSFSGNGSQLRWKVELTRPTPSDPSPLVQELRIDYDTRVQDHLVHVSSTDVVHYGIAISQLLYPSNHTARAILLSREDEPVDAFAAVSLATITSGSLLFTPRDALHPDTATEMARVVAADTNPTVYVLGGPDAISPAVVTELVQRGYRAVRLQGNDRYQTAASIAQEVRQRNSGATTTVYLSEATILADAFSASPVAGDRARGPVAPMLLTPRATNTIGDDAVSALRSLPDLQRIEIIGGPESITDAAYTQLAGLFPGVQLVRTWGTDRFATNQSIVRNAYVSPTSVALAIGRPEASPTGRFEMLLASVVAATNSGPLLLTEVDALPTFAKQYLYEQAPSLTLGIVIGRVIDQSDTLFEQLTNLISRP